MFYFSVLFCGLLSSKLQSPFRGLRPRGFDVLRYPLHEASLCLVSYILDFCLRRRRSRALRLRAPGKRDAMWQRKSNDETPLPLPPHRGQLPSVAAVQSQGDLYLDLVFCLFVYYSWGSDVLRVSRCCHKASFFSVSSILDFGLRRRLLEVRGRRPQPGKRDACDSGSRKMRRLCLCHRVVANSLQWRPSNCKGTFICILSFFG